MNNLVLLSELAEEVRMDKSAARKCALANGFEFLRIRSIKTRGAKALALTREDADRFRNLRIDQYQTGLLPISAGSGSTKGGFLYMIQLVPDIAPLRIKLGYADSIKARLQDHRTAAPTASVYASWPCLPTWESPAIASISRMECVPLSNEVFDCASLENVKGRADDFFAIMPCLDRASCSAVA